jgi:LuxR family maltose regulon positive regulatory protein
MREAGATGRRGLRAVPVPGSSALPDMLMEAKLHAPSLRKEWVERRELISVLAATAAKVVLIEAPAGFGKTTLAAQWRASPLEERSFAWVSLDRGDDDPGTLWWYIAHALQRACPGLGVDEVFRALRVPVPDITGTVIPLLVHELAALRTPVVLVLDDYQLIKEPSRHEQTAFLLLHLPPSVEIVLVTRTDPPLPLARLRAAGEMLEIRMPELRLEPSEAAALVQNVSGFELPEPDLAVLLQRNEGWPAGLYLAALSLRGHPAPGAFIRQFSGDNRFIVDFLAEEVLSRQPGHIRQFLARTAVLDRFCAPLCDAVTGSAHAAEVIDVLERENLFLIPLDDNRQWYRYHHLFAQVLRGQLARTEPGVGPTLYERASAWHRESGSTDEAIGYALAAGDVAGAVDLIARHRFAYVDAGRAPLDEARNILTSLPEGAVAQLSRLERLEQRITTRQSRVISPSDALTEREVAVLRLLGGTLTLREIGQEMHLSQNTVKTHTRAIYRKLGVSTRHAAVEKGREISAL